MTTAKKMLLAAALLGAVGGIEDIAGHVRNATRPFYGNRSDGKRNRRLPGVRKQRDKNKTARKSRVQNKGR